MNAKESTWARLVRALGQMTVGAFAALMLFYNILLTISFILLVGAGWGCR